MRLARASHGRSSLPDAARPAAGRGATRPGGHCARPQATRYTAPVEFLNFLLIFACGYLLLRHPERERLAWGLAVTSVLLMAFLFLVGTRTSLLPGLNY